MFPDTDALKEPVLQHLSEDFAVLQSHLTVEQALMVIRQRGLGEKIVYFYVVDEQERLVGVIPTRRLLTDPLDAKLDVMMIRRVIAVPATATLLEACECFVLHKFYAFPVIDKNRRILGVVNVGMFTERIFDLAERESVQDVFESIGFHVAQVRDASAVKAFRFRFPWLLATITSGTLCALLAGTYQATLEQSVVLAFFLTLVLGLGESVSIQSMTVTLQSLRSAAPSLAWYVSRLRQELPTAILLGLACGSLVALIVWIWRGQASAALAIGSAITFSITSACWIGLSIPATLRALKLDPRIAAGPVTLALTDISTLLIYFSVATALLRHAS